MRSSEVASSRRHLYALPLYKAGQVVVRLRVIDRTQFHPCQAAGVFFFTAKQQKDFNDRNH